MGQVRTKVSVEPWLRVVITELIKDSYFGLELEHLERVRVHGPVLLVRSPPTAAAAAETEERHEAYGRENRPYDPEPAGRARGGHGRGGRLKLCIKRREKQTTHFNFM